MEGIILDLNTHDQSVLSGMPDSRDTLTVGDTVVATFCNAGFSTFEGILETVGNPMPGETGLCFPADEGIYEIEHAYHVVLKSDFVRALSAR